MIIDEIYSNLYQIFVYKVFFKQNEKMDEKWSALVKKCLKELKDIFSICLNFFQI